MPHRVVQSDNTRNALLRSSAASSQHQQIILNNLHQALTIQFTLNDDRQATTVTMPYTIHMTTVINYR